MNESRKLGGILKALTKVLTLEKEVLIKNDAVTLISIVEQKNLLINEMEAFQGIDFSENEEIRKMISSMANLQETNQLLTKQALSFQNEILKALAKTNTSKHNTYSASGQLSAQKEVSIVDQSV
ncbi:MAG: hypothetical protein WBI17_08575 [Clostridiaceae bacterium]